MFLYGRPQRLTVVPEVAIGTDQGTRSVLVVNGAGELERRTVTPGTKSGVWRVLDGEVVRTGELIVLPGRPGLRPGMKVEAVQEVLR